MPETKSKLVFFLPNTFTALNLACGFGSIILALQQNYYLASMIIVLGAIFDSVDGRIARLTGAQSPFGEQFDSISDVVTFGMAPAFLVYTKFFFDLGKSGMVIAFIFLLCGALRLARFNANIDKISSDFFQGLPIPAAAFGLVGYVLLTTAFPELNDLPIVIPAIYVVFYALMMISSMPFCSFKKSPWVKNHKRLALLSLLLLLCLTFIFEQIMIFLIISSYTLGSFIYFFSNNGTIRDIILWNPEKEDDTDA